MKICKHCQAENSDDLKFCTACGEELETEAAEAAEEAEAVETAEVTEETEAAEVTEEAPAKKSPVAAIVLGVLALLALVGVVLAVVLLGRDKPAEAPAETPAEGEFVEAERMPAHHVNAYGYNSHAIHYTANEDGTYTYDYMNENGETVSLTQEEVDALLDVEVAECNGDVLTNREIMFFYNEQYYNTYTSYGSMLSMLLDANKAFDEQLSLDGTNTWEQSFVRDGLNMYHQMAAVAAAAEKDGFEPQTPLDEQVADMEDQLNAMAEQYGMESGQAYVDAYFGPGTTVEHYMDFFRLNLYAVDYINDLYAKMEITDEEIEKYYDDNVEYLQASQRLTKVNDINVRHILITPEETTAEDGTTSISDEAWAAAEAEANRIYDLWKADPTEDNFAELATEYTTDPGSKTTGGLYNGVYPGQMVTEFNDWCFAEERQAGDTGVVKTSYGYHVMFFSGEADTANWKTVVDGMIRDEKTGELLTQLQEEYPITADQGKVVLMTDQAPTIPAVEEEAPAEDETSAQETDGEQGAFENELPRDTTGIEEQ